jgi:Cu/Ag efflux protein CusF
VIDFEPFAVLSQKQVEHAISAICPINIMKTTALRTCLAVCVSVLATTGMMRVFADQDTATQPVNQGEKMKIYTGTVTAVDPNKHTMAIQDYLVTRRFDLGSSCVYALLDNNTLNGLRPGQEVKVTCLSDHGVLVANRINQEPLRHEGMITDINLTGHTLMLRSSGFTRQMRIGDDCAVALRDHRSGALSDIKPGSYVTVTFEKPEGKLVARQIAQTSETFTGSLTAIDLNDRTVKAKSLVESKQFDVARDCSIVINGKIGGHMDDLRPGEKLMFSYDNVDGVNVVNRIANNESAPESTTASAPMSNPAGAP